MMGESRCSPLNLDWAWIDILGINIVVKEWSKSGERMRGGGGDEDTGKGFFPFLDFQMDAQPQWKEHIKKKGGRKEG
jgi:hypothetical protein